MLRKIIFVSSRGVVIGLELLIELQEAVDCLRGVIIVVHEAILNQKLQV